MRAEVVLRFHAHDVDGRCIQIEKSVEAHDQADASALLALLAELGERLSFEIEDSWIEIRPREDEGEAPADD